MEKKDQIICQSCAMPLTEEFFGTNRDGSVNKEYCTYCYKDGSFTENKTMEEIIEHNLEYLDEFNKDTGTSMSKEEAREQMRLYFPTLKRWNT
ncbi:MAG: zinc ribbon domain-containing protein [Bacteroidales bacterium]|nr:zinc ribbon domain-containing protein [Bacteroidales bacterium]